jgi:hypothetical protein
MATEQKEGESTAKSSLRRVLGRTAAMFLTAVMIIGTGQSAPGLDSRLALRRE